MGVIENLQETTAFIRSVSSLKPKIGIVLGSGQGDVDLGPAEVELPCVRIPEFPRPRVKGHVWEGFCAAVLLRGIEGPATRIAPAPPPSARQSALRGTARTARPHSYPLGSAPSAGLPTTRAT